MGRKKHSGERQNGIQRGWAFLFLVSYDYFINVSLLPPVNLIESNPSPSATKCADPAATHAARRSFYRVFRYCRIYDRWLERGKLTLELPNSLMKFSSFPLIEIIRAHISRWTYIFRITLSYPMTFHGNICAFPIIPSKRNLKLRKGTQIHLEYY